MATSSEMRTITSSIEGLEDEVSACYQVAIALIETYQSWRWWPGDYRRARRQVLQTLRESASDVRRLRRETSSAELIRAEPVLLELPDYCLECPSANTERTTAGKDFVCYLQDQLDLASGKEPSFEFDEKGYLVERP